MERMFDLTTLLDGLPEDVTILFFAAFSRFEYALMRSRYLQRGKREACADWTKLAAELGDGFFGEVQRCGGVSTLINNQPKKLAVRNAAAVFVDELPPVENTADLLKSAKRVRHNLFHGNKMFANDRKRDERLMREVLWLLEFIMERRPHIRAAFDGS
jgi:hypothetical protein